MRRAKCGSCHGYNSTAGRLVHGRACEHCGAVIYRHIIDGTVVRFRFTSPGERGLEPELQMTAQRWDADEGFLYLKPGFLDRSWGVASGAEAERRMARHAGQWELVEEGHGKAAVNLYKIRYTLGLRRSDDDVIDMADVSGHDRNHEVVRIWDGREYPEFGEMPVREGFSIYETWHWAPLDASPALHKRLLLAIGNTDDKGWHYQDGTPWFKAESWKQIGLFIRHFTTLDAAEWDRQSRRFPLDGPGGIDAVAAFCHPLAVPQNEPNIGNFLTAAGKTITGLPVSRAEEAAALDAVVFDSTTAEFINAMHEHGQQRAAKPGRRDTGEGRPGPRQPRR